MVKVNMIFDNINKGNKLVEVKGNKTTNIVPRCFRIPIEIAFKTCSLWNSYVWRDGSCQIDCLIDMTEEEYESFYILHNCK